MVLDTPDAMFNPTVDTLLAQALDTLAAGGMPALRLATLLVLGLLGIACLLLPLFVHPPG
ncbi:hypothetical protein [Aquabacterium sp. J223]|uniref:hypothetical protein n=1 Tax=Aquabacterium sp. J223 TaxID=2898431 RepID=UPI0021AD9A1E|nr:hypothetical protein [Aquabacterium sp. J223]UUX97005.1 hypothetical protein LRS07_07030 [Aquabacterium sp. J223]